MGSSSKFSKPGDLFKGVEKAYQPKAADGDPLPSDSKKMVTTVMDRLAWTEKPVIELLDYEASRDKTNMKANRRKS